MTSFVIAIHSINSRFSERWIQYCRENNIDYLEVDIFNTDIIDYLRDKKVKVLLAQPTLNDYKTSLIAKSILLVIEKTGIITFPNYNALWHYDDKISQKYLFEALDIPHAQNHVFYNKGKAQDWLRNASFPVVFKLRGGAGSSNVLLLKNRKDSSRFLRKMFTTGLKPIRPVFNDFRTKLEIHSNQRDWIRTLLRFPQTIRIIIGSNKKMQRQNGYFLAQEFLPGNKFDTRVVVVGDKAFAFRRFTRPNDFRASGSKAVDLRQDKIDKRCIQLAFESAHKIGSSSMAFDIIYNIDNQPVIIEMSYTCPPDTINKIGAYWDKSLIMHHTSISLEDFIIEHVIGKVKELEN